MKNSNNVIEEIEKEKYTTKIQTSFGIGDFFRSFLLTVFSARVFAFYENEIRLDVTLVLIAYILYGLWNMFNDPLIGYISDRPNRFWNRWGRRFPWILMSGIPYCLCIILIFTPPNVDATTHAIIIFAWLLFTICLFDGFYSVWITNYYALFPDKFRSDKERRKILGIGTPLAFLSLGLGTMLPPLFIVYGNKQSYIIAMIIMASISLLTFFFTLPGCREDREMIEKAKILAYKKEKQDPFFQTLKYALKQKNFVAYLIAYLSFHILFTIILASIPYIVPYILNMQAIGELYISAVLLLACLAAVPFWFVIVRKYGARKMFLIGLFWPIFVLIPLLLVNNLIGVLICFAILGFGVSSLFFGNQLIFSDCIDEIVIERQKRQEGVFLGIRTFIIRLSIIVQALTFWAVHISTGFDPSLEKQSDLALFGLRVQFALVPIIIITLCGIIFLKYYDLTSEKVNFNKLKLKELNL
jgi:GPH family glycoside/pentoside/hexuronide:cation symporter